MSFSPFTISVPATTANLGPGFDSLGLSLSLYQKMHVSPAEKWAISYVHADHQGLPVDESNLILKTVRTLESEFNVELHPCRLEVASDIPLARGLGSSAAAIVAAIALVDRVAGLGLSPLEQVEVASRIEGHPDNVSAAVLGGLTVSRDVDGKLSCLRLPVPDARMMLVIPAEELSTSASRGALPAEVSHGTAAATSAAANVLVAAIAAGDWRTAGEMMELDGLHEPFRAQWLPYMGWIRERARELGAYGSTISGAGPTLLVVAPEESVAGIRAVIEGAWSSLDVVTVLPDVAGVSVEPAAEGLVK